ncbi:hypothetical protein D9M69_529920 [compost metagenome]
MPLADQLREHRRDVELFDIHGRRDHLFHPSGTVIRPKRRGEFRDVRITQPHHRQPQRSKTPRTTFQRAAIDPVPKVNKPRKTPRSRLRRHHVVTLKPLSMSLTFETRTTNTTTTATIHVEINGPGSVRLLPHRHIARPQRTCRSSSKSRICS